MRILMLSLESNFLNPHSAQAQRLLMHAAHVESLDVIVPERREHKTAPVRLAPNIMVYPVARGGKLTLFRKFLRTAKVVGRSRGIYSKSLVVTSQDPFELGWIAWAVARKLHATLHVQLHTDVSDPFFAKESPRRRVQVLIAKFVLPRADGIRVVSQRIKRGIETWGIPEEKIDVIPITTPIENFANATVTTDLREKYPTHSPLILMASRLTREKNIPLALRAFATFHESHPSAGLVIVGKGPEEDALKALVRELKLDDSVAFEPWTDTIASYMKTADIFLLTSNYEGWAVSVIEAAAAGLPVIMTDVGCAGECIVHDESGLVVPVGGASAITHALTILVDPQERRRLAQGATARLGTLSDHEAWESRVIASYEQALVHHAERHKA